MLFRIANWDDCSYFVIYNLIICYSDTLDLQLREMSKNNVYLNIDDNWSVRIFKVLFFCLLLFSEVLCCFVMRCNKFICRCPLRRIPFSTFCLFCQYQFTLNVYLYSLQGYSVNGNCVIINITRFAVTKGNNNSFLVQHEYI